ncbi:MAG: hypothetical protein WC102_00385, partial [Saccharofermentanales bacterium]
MTEPSTSTFAASGTEMTVGRSVDGVLRMLQLVFTFVISAYDLLLIYISVLIKTTSPSTADKECVPSA